MRSSIYNEIKTYDKLSQEKVAELYEKGNVNSKSLKQQLNEVERELDKISLSAENRLLNTIFGSDEDIKTLESNSQKKKKLLKKRKKLEDLISNKTKKY